MPIDPRQLQNNPQLQATKAAYGALHGALQGAKAQSPYTPPNSSVSPDTINRLNQSYANSQSASTPFLEPPKKVNRSPNPASQYVGRQQSQYAKTASTNAKNLSNAVKQGVVTPVEAAQYAKAETGGRYQSYQPGSMPPTSPPGSSVPSSTSGGPPDSSNPKSSLPGVGAKGIAGGSLAVGAVGFALDVVQGGDPLRGAFVYGIGTLGAFAGVTVGTGGGVFGTIVGGSIGFAAGAKAGENLYNFFFPPGKQKNNQPTPRNIHARGISGIDPNSLVGQSYVPYNVKYTLYSDNVNQQTGEVTQYNAPDTRWITLNGKILGVMHRYEGTPATRIYIGLITQDANGTIHGRDGFFSSSQISAYCVIDEIVRVDGLPESGAIPQYPAQGNIPPNAYKPPVTNNYYTKNIYQSNPYTPPPSSLPKGVDSKRPSELVASPTSAPNEKIKKKPSVFDLPGDKPVEIQFPDSPPLTFPPPGDPFSIKAPNKKPTDDNPFAPFEVSSPGSKPYQLVSPGTGPVTIKIPGMEPIVVDPLGNTQPKGATPLLFEPYKFEPIPLTPTPTPTPTRPPTQTPSPVPTVPPTQTPAPTTPPIPIDPNVATAFAAITVLLRGIHQNTTPAAIQNASRTATCSTLQPGGCMSGLNQNAANAANNSAANNNLLNGANLGANAANHTLLNTLLSRVGAQIPGGLSGGLIRMSKFLGIDRLFNLINFAANLHNALMLSNTLKVTLLETLGSVGNATGLLQTSEGDNVDLNSVFNQGIDKFMILILGEENYAGLKVTWRKYNRIYQAATNSVNAISSMFNSIGNVVETTAEYTGKIGNSLKGAGAVAENAYQWMSEKMNAKMSKFIKFETSVGATTQVLETINEIAESVVEGQQAATEFQKANKDFVEAVANAQKNSGTENKAVAEEMKKQKENASKDPTGEDEDGLLSFLTDL